MDSLGLEQHVGFFRIQIDALCATLFQWEATSIYGNEVVGGQVNDVSHPRAL